MHDANRNSAGPSWADDALRSSLRADGGLGGYRGGLDAKSRLLELERTV